MQVFSCLHGTKEVSIFSVCLYVEGGEITDLTGDDSDTEAEFERAFNCCHMYMGCWVFDVRGPFVLVLLGGCLGMEQIINSSAQLFYSILLIHH